MKSMTGFGKAECLNNNRKITIEIRTLNSKLTDVSIKTPNLWKDRELEIRNELINHLNRGKVELHISIEEAVEEMTAQFNETAIVKYYRQIADIATQNNIPLPPDVLCSIVCMPDVIKLERQETNEQEWHDLLLGIRQALEQVNSFREQEGLTLKKDILSRMRLIEAYITDIEEFESQRIDAIKNRLRQSLIDYAGETVIDQNRFEQELIYYLEKIDINEEKVRLRNHCSYFAETANDGDGIGKKLGFIAQEIGREINTIGSKANNADMQQIVVRMKDELEKIKEQLLNVL